MKLTRWLQVPIVLVVGIVVGILLYVEYQEYRKSNYDEDYIDKAVAHWPKKLNEKAVNQIINEVNPAKFRFVVMGDCHDNYKLCNKLMNSAYTYEPKFFIMDGDFTDKGSLREYKAYLNFLQGVKIPIINVIGNHDVRELGEEIYDEVFGPMDFYFDLGEYRFVILDTTHVQKLTGIVDITKNTEEYEADEGISEEQIDELDQLLAAKKKTMLFMHHPPSYKEWAPHSFKHNADELLDLTAKYKDYILAVFLGHIHGYDEEIIHGVPFIISAGAGGNFHKGRDFVTKKHNFVVVDIENGSFNTKVHFMD